MTFIRLTVEPASALPVTVGVESFVTAESVSKEIGAFGVDVSIVMDIAEDLVETLPAESVAVAVIEYSPSEIALTGVNEKLPSLSAVVVPNEVESIKRVTLELGSAFPEIVGVELFISEIWVREVGAFGAVVSIVMDSSEDSEEVLSAESVALAVRE